MEAAVIALHLAEDAGKPAIDRLRESDDRRLLNAIEDNPIPSMYAFEQASFPPIPAKLSLPRTLAQIE
jgi:hypothetical protein